MGNSCSIKKKNISLRKRAEEKLHAMLSKFDNIPENNTFDIKKILHELQVYQIELEMQNDELLLTQERIEETNQKYIDLYNNSPVSYFIIDEFGKVFEVNLTGEILLGLNKNEIINSSFTDFIYREDQDKYYLYLKQVVSKKEIISSEIRLKNKNGNVFHTHIDSILVNQNQIRSTITDISQRKNIEKLYIESQRLNAIGEMSAGIAHDFNNSLQIILANIEISQYKNKHNQPIENHLKVIQNATIDAASRIQLLQRFGAANPTKNTYDIVDLNKIILDIISQTRPIWKDQAGKRGCNIDIVENLKEISNAKGNESELKNVLFNLIKNSIEAMPDGGSITIETTEKENNISLLITDTGIGMDEYTRLRIFQPFYSTKGFEKGRGLGLASTFSIVQEHKGIIKVVDSEVGKGTTIELLLPKVLNKQKINCEKISKPIDSSINVLLIDDEKHLREAGEAIIEIIGCKGKVVASGEEALEILDKEKFNLVITDLGMPGMNGWELADIIRTKYGKKIKIVVLTGWGVNIDEKTKLKHQVNCVLSKPISISELENAVYEMNSNG